MNQPSRLRREDFGIQVELTCRGCVCHSFGPSSNSATKLRTLQLEHRSQELYETLHSFRTFTTSSSPSSLPANFSIATEDGHPHHYDQTKWLSAWTTGIVNTTNDIILAGHSFGGATVLSILQTPPPSSWIDTPLSISKAIVLDPWLEPLPTPAPSKDKKDRPEVPLLVINSEGFTLWETHFKRLVGVVKDCGGSLMTIVGANRESEFERTMNDLERDVMICLA